jgi:sugar phosphate isomerase/epimerase
MRAFCQLKKSHLELAGEPGSRDAAVVGGTLWNPSGREIEVPRQPGMTRMSIVLYVLTTIFAAGAIRANPFFAMDTAVRDLNALETVKALGYDGISWKTGKPADVAADAAQIRQRGLKLYAVYSYQYATLTKTNLVLPPQLDGVMEALKGTDAVLWLPINSKDFPVSSSDGDAVAVPALQRLADRAAKHGLRVAIYPHKNCWAERVQDAVRLAKKVARENFGATFNLCHCLMVGDETKIPALLTEAAPHLFLVTINGADTAAGKATWNRAILPLDEGGYDVNIVLRKLEELNYTGPIGLQGYGVSVPVTDNLTRSMSAWRKLNERE